MLTVSAALFYALHAVSLLIILSGFVLAVPFIVILYHLPLPPHTK